MNLGYYESLKEWNDEFNPLWRIKAKRENILLMSMHSQDSN
jgi:hypothetical protein